MIDKSLLRNKTFLITGATGLIGKTLIEYLLKAERDYKLNAHIIATGRSKKKFIERFRNIDLMNMVTFIETDISDFKKINSRINYIVHLASNTHPKLYASDPIGTEMNNILGTYNLLNIASKQCDCRFLLASSGDIYGDNIYNNDFIKEEDCGYINCNTLRACYTEAKRACESLCNAFLQEQNTDFVIARLCRVFGSNIQLGDSRSISQFIFNAVYKQNIILKSKGDQMFSYLSEDEVVEGILHVLLYGQKGEAYNVAENNSVSSLKDLAELLANIANTTVEFTVLNEEEKRGYSTVKNVKLDGSKLKALGFNTRKSLQENIIETVIKLRNKLC